MDIQKYLRPMCKSFEPYVAGKPVETIKRELGLKNVIKLASNENPLGPSKKAIDEIKKSAEKVYFYPDSNSFNLTSAISKKFNVKQDNILFGCGSDEIIEIIAKTFFNKGEELIISDHSFIEYKRAGNLMDCKVVVVPMNGYTHNLTAMLSASTKKTKAFIIANPNNPTGTYNTKSEVEAFLKGLKKKYGNNMPLVIFDEAYYEYARIFKNYPETIKYLKKYPNLIILRTFSKIYGLAGLRVGYGFASTDITSYINRIRPPFNVNTLAQNAAAASLMDKNQVTKSVKLANEGRKYLYSEFKKMGLEFVPSAANFILFKTKLPGKELFQKLLYKGIIVRGMNEYDYPYHVRVSIGLKEENIKFIRALKEVLNKNI